jgi:hypothetical protein
LRLSTTRHTMRCTSICLQCSPWCI